jgi:ketosteroid isomerase-like protein
MGQRLGLHTEDKRIFWKKLVAIGWISSVFFAPNFAGYGFCADTIWQLKQIILDKSIKMREGKPDTVAMSDDEAAIRALEDRFTAAFNARDIDGIMENYIPDNSLVVFDVVPRKQYLGADGYRKDWVDFFSHFKGSPKIAISDLGIAVEGNLGFGHSFQRVTGTDKQGHSIDRTVRVSNGYRKIGGNWLIALEHISVPVDLTTGKVAP